MSIQKNWDLPAYFYQDLSDPKLQKDIDAIIPAVVSFCDRFRGKISMFATATDFLEYYEALETIEMIGDRPGHFLFYTYALDTQNTDVQKKMGELEVLGIQIAEKMLFISQEFKQLGAEKLRSFAQMPELAAYKNDLLGRADTVQYILEEKQEYVLNKKSRPLSVLGSIHDELRNSLTFTIKIDGEKKTMNEEEIRKYARDPDRKKRKAASKATRKTYLTPQNQLVFGNTYGGIIKNWTSNTELRGYETVMHKRNISEELPNHVVDKLIEKTQQYYGLNERFLAAKKKHLGLKKMYGYDMHAPIKKIQKQYTIEQALEKHLSVMKEFDATFHDYSLDMFTAGRVDVMPVQGKRGGAFASYSKGQESFVLLNFTGNLDDIFTLTHEMGHAIHGHLAQVQKECVYDAPLCLAETASIFNEQLLTKHIESELTTGERLELLNQKLQDVTGTIFRQVMYTSFERRVHEEISAGKELTYKEFNTYWHEESSKLTGDVITSTLDPDQNFVWSAIPHIFHTPFYCYTYAFGMILSFALMDTYEKRGSDFISDYKEILASGGSVRPEKLLAGYGIDIASDAFYDAAFAKIETLVEEFENI